MKNFIFIFFSISILYSCSSPLDKKYDEKNFEKVLTALRNNKDTATAMLIVGTVIREGMEGKKIEGKTYREILEDGKKWKAEQDKIEAEQKALAEKAKKDEEDRIKRLNGIAIVTCFEKGYIEYDYQNYITLKFVIQNKSEKEIRAIKGTMKFTNLFDEEIKNINFVYDDKPISIGKQATWDGTIKYNEFRDEDVTFKSKDLKDMKMVWNPEKIIFVDGSTIE